MGAEDAMDEDDDDVDFNPYLQLSPSLEGASGDSSDGEGEIEEAEDDVELEVQEESLNREDLQSSEKETEREKDLDDDDFLELGSDDYEEEDIEDEEQDDMVQGGGISKVGEYSSRSISLDKDGKYSSDQSRLDKNERSNNRDVAGDQDTDALKQASESDDSPFLTLDSSKISDAFEHETEAGLPGRSMGTLPELRIFRRGIQSGEILRGDNSEDIGDHSVDAISKRTRAHYSLADMSLDQLEMFLQESDEEEYFQNVDDEEEYRKFLLAVQEKQDGGSEHCERQGRKEDEDDEEEDADFEFEIEEALESDYEYASGSARKRKRRRPETRENRRQRAKAQSKGLQLSQSKAPLRPLLPHISSLTQYNPTEKRKTTDGADQVWAPNSKKKVPVNGFTAHQIGQLYCLIHEHVQLLVQVHAMCILEPSRQQITNDTHRMLMEIADKRDVLLSWKKTAFPDFCFGPPYTHPSFTENEEETPLRRFQFPSDPAGSNLAACSRDATGGAEAYPLSLARGSDCDLLSWRSVESGSLTSAASLGQLNMLPSNPVGFLSQSGSIPGSTDATSFLRNHPSEMSHSWHHTFSIPQTPGAGQTKMRAPYGTQSSDRSSESNFVQVGACYGEGSLIRTTPVKSVPHATTHISNSCSSATSSNTAQPFSVYADDGIRQVSPEWAPATSGPVRSLLDVAPLALMREFLNDMSRVAEDYRQRHVESGAYHSQCEREPLFTISVADLHEGDARRNSKPRTSGLSLNGEALPVSAPRIQIKKTMAAALVESTKKECLALVPTDVAKAVKRFLPFFNPALFPHKPPPVAAANRLLFTDAEDELLAMGLMMYNTDWTAIQQRFLPSKSMHQIFVRQKNRSSARAPENSIKAVRRMKSSPLTAVEKARIQEGLKIYKYDWNKVWEFCVPHRDPAVLPRQWRIALGTQKSYKTSETSKERRRIYEANRRQAKKAIEYVADIRKDCGPSSVETGIGGRDVLSGEEDGYDEEAYIREAFLADWCPSKSPSVRASAPPPGGPQSQRPKTKSSLSRKRKARLDEAPDARAVSSHPSSDLGPGPSAWFNRQALMFSTNTAKQTVKLAPGLPSVKLPPHVHILSQSLVPALSALSSTAAGEFSANSVSSAWPHITGQNWSRPGQTTERTLPLNPPRYLSPTFLPRNVGGRPVSQGTSMQKYRSNSKPVFLPPEHVGMCPSQAIPQQTELPVGNGAANSTLTGTNVDLRRLAKNLDKKFGISQPIPSLDLNRLHTSVRSSAELVEIHASPIHAPPPKESPFAASQSLSDRFDPSPEPPSCSGPTSFTKSSRLSLRRRKVRVPVVSSKSSNTEEILTSPEALSTGNQKCDIPQTSVQAVTSSPPTVGLERQNSSTAARPRSDCKAGSPSELSSDDPSKASKTFTREDTPDQQVACFPFDPSYPSSRQKEQALFRGPFSKKSIAGRSKKLATVKQLAGGARQNCYQVTTNVMHGSRKVQPDGFESGKGFPPTAPEAGLTSGSRKRKQKIQETPETLVEDPISEPHVIVMEQEELSDSEDEAGMGVEFEHEEMGDSDKDVELELGASNQTKESSIEFEEEEIESDKEKEEDSRTAEHVQERMKERLLPTAAKSSVAAILRRDKCTQVQSSAQDEGQRAVSSLTKTRESSEMTAEVLSDCTDSKRYGKTSRALKRKQARKGIENRATGKSKGFELNGGGSRQVHKRSGHDSEKNTRAGEKKKTEAEYELASAIAAAEVLAVIRQVPAVSRK